MMRAFYTSCPVAIAKSLLIALLVASAAAPTRAQTTERSIPGLAEQLNSTEPPIVQRALRALAQISVQASPSEQLESYRARRRELLALRPKIFTLMSDPVRQTLLDALECASSFVYELSGDGRKTVDLAFGHELSARYDVEPDATIRARIVNTLAVFEPEDRWAHDAAALVARGVHDDAPGVRQAAVLAVGHNRISDLLPQVAEMARADPDDNVRAAATDVIRKRSRD